jgi:hypothetical protein
MLAWMMSAGFAFARAASQPIRSGERDFDAAIWERSAKTANHHFIEALGPVVVAPGARRSSPPPATFSPGTGLPPPAVVSVEAQPLNPQTKATRRAIIERYFMRLEK